MPDDRPDTLDFGQAVHRAALIQAMECRFRRRRWGRRLAALWWAPRIPAVRKKK